jgi:hypothetical protein
MSLKKDKGMLKDRENFPILTFFKVIILTSSFYYFTLTCRDFISRRLVLVVSRSLSRSLDRVLVVPRSLPRSLDRVLSWNLSRSLVLVLFR